MQNESCVRWHLECIPESLDKFVRHRQIEEGKRYICQQVVADLRAYYQILAEREQKDDIIK